MALQGVRTGLIVGCFDPIHEGHFDHIQAAAEHCDRLIVVTHLDQAVIEKKGYCLQSYETRREILRGLLKLWEIDGKVVAAADDLVFDLTYKDGIVLTLRQWKPDVFIKGGDRTPDNMPESEVNTCKELGIEIIYGVGKLLGSSSNMVEKAFKALAEKGVV